MVTSVRNWLLRLGAALALVLLLVLGARIYDAWRSPRLPLWLTEAPAEPSAKEIDDLDWTGWLAAEAQVFRDVHARVTSKLTPRDLEIASRFRHESSSETTLFAQWNRSQVLHPDGAPRGVVVLLHGLTDAPYSLRHIATHYRERGFIAVAIRLPGHGTAPAALTRIRWEDWTAAVCLAVRHARSLAAEPLPLHVVGYSNGAALAMKYALDALEDTALAPPDQLVLISPMIGITSMARFAGVLGWPAAFPPFAKAAWLEIAPEYNPVKYNSFAVNAARQSSQLTRAVRKQLVRLQQAGELAKLAPVLTFQSLLDSTVDVEALVTTLYSRLPVNGSELVIFDRNRSAALGPLLRPGMDDLLSNLLPPPPRNFHATVVGDRSERNMPAAAAAEVARDLAAGYPADVYSLSHVALPFPERDELYGSEALGNRTLRGERGVLAVSPEVFLRMSWNPFFDYLLARIDARLPAPPESVQQPGFSTGQ